ncbi:MAG: glycoside hydrolase family 88 protein [Verrucomicrobiales bacterium]|nr:glycoside hydrolase family 88 protein [Verrucomicrobiales bacterium]
MKLGLIIAILTITLTGHAENLEERISRTPDELIGQLLDHYGTVFRGSYVEALSVIVRSREEGLESIKPIVAGQLESPAKLSNGGVIAGRLIFAELAAENPLAKQRVIDAADLAFNEDGSPKPAMPFHSEMSDAIFMAGPILAKAGALTGERKYFDQAVQQIKYIQKLCLRDDGIYRHSPLDESAWGRGNGFPAIGIAMILEDLPASHPGYDVAKTSLLNHLEALKPHQDKSGMWHQVIDHPESYPEFTCTCMISYAALVAKRNGWLESKEWDDAIRKSWKAICSRIDLSGRNVEGACTGTGKQKSLEAYLTRKEIYGFDDRSGSMALLLASEAIKLRADFFSSAPRD